MSSPDKCDKNEEMKWSLKTKWPILWLFLLAALALLPFISLRRCFHNDLAAQTFPLLLFANDAFRSGSLPLWDPFQDCGMPHFSNPQSHLWYPPHLLIFGTVGYSFYSMQYEFLFHFLLAGICCYVLARKFKLSYPASALSASSYMLSGIFIGHSEHLNIMVTFAWVPLVLAGIQGWLDQKTKGNLWLAGIGLFLLLQGGNPSANLIALFLIGGVVAARLAERIYDRGWNRDLVKEFGKMVSAFLLAGLISGISLVPMLSDFAEYSGREQGLPYQTVLEFNPLRVWALLSLILPTAPFVSLLEVFQNQTSITMLNCYFGIISLLLALFALYSGKSRDKLILAGIGLAGLLISLGSRGMLRGLLFELAPFLRYLKHPALFRGIFILFFCLLAGFGLDDLVNSDSRAVEKFRRTILLVLISFGLILGFAAALTVALAPLDPETSRLLKDLFLESLPIQISLLLAFYFWLRSDRKYWAIGILFLAGLDLGLMVQANLDLAGDYFDYTRRKILVDSIQNRSRQMDRLTRLSRVDTWPNFENNGMVYKKFETSDYASVSSVTYRKIMDTGFHRVVGQSPFFFLVPAVSVNDNLEDALLIFKRASIIKAMPALVVGEPPLEIKTIAEAAYSLESLGLNRVRVINYSINRMELEFENSTPMVLGSTEGYHPGWRATLDGKAVETVKFNFAFRGVYLTSPGNHRLVWNFQPGSFKLGILATILGILLLGAWAIFSWLKPIKETGRPG